VGNGKKAKAPCNHDGEHVIGQYIQCLQHCDLWDEDTLEFDLERCPFCGKDEVDTDFQLDPDYLKWNHHATRFNRRCWSCGGLFIV
jgi:hypothetical protein